MTSEKVKCQAVCLCLQSAYIQHKQLAGAQGVKITGKDMEKALAGTPVLVAKYGDEVEVLKVSRVQ